MRNFYIALLALVFAPLFGAHALVTEESILNFVNAERRNAGLGEVVFNAKLSEAAQIKADDMAARNYFDHVTPEGKDPWHFLAQVGYEWSWTGENLALNTNTESEAAIVKAWMDSPGHRSIILDSRYTETGIGIAIGTFEGQRAVYVSEYFGVPKVAQSQVKVETVIPVQAPAQVAQTVVVPTKPVQTPKVIAKPAVQEAIPATTTQTVAKEESGKEIVGAVIESIPTPIYVPEQLPLIVRIKNFIVRLFTFANGRVG